MKTKIISNRLEVLEEDLVVHSNPFNEWDLVPEKYIKDGSGGASYYHKKVYIITHDGKWHEVPPEFESSSNYAYTPIIRESGQSVGEFISKTLISSSDIHAIVVDEVDFYDWTGSELTDERKTEIFPAKAIDVSKIRRRVEYALRKTNNESTILSLAVRLGVKID
jgi:hypothetical protein